MNNKMKLALDITETIRLKIAYDMGRYDDDLPDDIECQDWLYGKVVDLFDELPESWEEQNNLLVG